MPSLARVMICRTLSHTMQCSRCITGVHRSLQHECSRQSGACLKDQRAGTGQARPPRPARLAGPTPHHDSHWGEGFHWLLVTHSSVWDQQRWLLRAQQAGCSCRVCKTRQGLLLRRLRRRSRRPQGGRQSEVRKKTGLTAEQVRVRSVKLRANSQVRGPGAGRPDLRGVCCPLS